MNSSKRRAVSDCIANSSRRPRLRLAPLAACISLLFAHGASHALSLGDIQIESSLGQPLRARVPVLIKAGEAVSDECVSVMRQDTDGDASGLITQARVQVIQAGGKPLLQVTSPQSMLEPVARLILHVNCAEQGSVYREYTLLLDPPQYQAPQAVELPSAPLPPAPSVAQPAQASAPLIYGINEYVVKEGDTLDKIARERYPNNTLQQRRLRQAIAAANSDVLSGEDSALPAVGTPLLIPQLSAIKTRSAKPKARKARPAKQQIARSRPSAAIQEALADATAPMPPTPAPRLAPAGEGSFVLRLSRSTIDFNASRPISETERAALRERQRLLDADDMTASMLSLQHEMRQMKAEIESLKAQLRSRADAPALPATSGGTVAQAPMPPAPPTLTPSTKPAAAGVPAASAPATKWYEPWLKSAQGWWWIVPLVALAGLVIALVRRRRTANAIEEDEFETLAPMRQRPVAAAPIDAVTQAPPAQAQPLAEPAAATPAEKAERTQAARETDMQERYLKDRFPELAEAGVSIADTDAVVEHSRVYFMEDGSADKAIELLEYTISRHPEQIKPWLALLEVYRQLKMKGAFEKLAIAFRDRFRDLAQWKKVCAIGAALDPRNPLYRVDEADSATSGGTLDLETEANPVGEQAVQNWLDIPLDFTPALRGEELRSKLLAELPEERAEPKAQEAQVLDLDLEFNADANSKERVEPKLVRKPSE